MCAEVDPIHVKIGIETLVKVEMNTIIVRHQENFTKIYTNGIKQEYKLMQVKYYIQKQWHRIDFYHLMQGVCWSINPSSESSSSGQNHLEGTPR